MSAQHTPGPWVARGWRHHSATSIVREVGESVRVIAEVDPVDGYGNHPEAAANARLIAAAPELLALAKQYASECGECDGRGVINCYESDSSVIDVTEPCPDCADIRAVIAKAEGAP